MTIRESVQSFIDLGPLPSSDDDLEPEDVDKLLRSLKSITKPISDEEAAALLGSFGPDDCYGLASVLLQLIESAPNAPPIHSRPDDSENEWIRRLWNAAVNAGRRSGPKAKQF